MTSLSPATIASVPSDVPVPSYRRDLVTPGIVHFGVGGFHRAHEAVYIDTLLREGDAFEWGILGVGLLPGDVRMRDVMWSQGCLYTVVLKHADGIWQPRVIGSIVGYLYAPDDPEAVLEALLSPRTRVVSLTITEGGYGIDPATGAFDLTTPAVSADLRSGAKPASVFGFVVEALARRRSAGTTPFTVVSCDNIQGNGHVAREAFVSFARARDPELAAWIYEHVHFPNSMVDRITPATTDADRAEIASRFSIEDGWPVVCEPFTQWVLEDHFGNGRPPLERVGVQLVNEVEPYELMKLRLLNASHQVLCYAGYLAGYRLVNDVTADPLFVRFLLSYMSEEAAPTLKPVPGIDLDEYIHELVQRFSNPQIRDTVQRLCANSSDLIPKFVLPVVRDRLAASAAVPCSTMAIACWARYAMGTDEQGAPIEIVDSRAERLGASARRQVDEPLAFLQNRDVFGDLADDRRFTGPYIEMFSAVLAQGARGALSSLLSGGSC
jgi:mannitol 2-dehydrogenase